MATFQECKPRQEGGTVRMAASEQLGSGACAARRIEMFQTDTV